MHDVFISYKAEEAAEAENVRCILEKNRISCWMAPDNIPSGSNYTKEIPVAIGECCVFLLMLSEKSQKSPWVRRELDTAVNRGKTIIPFEIEACRLNDEFDFLLNGVQRCAAYQKKAEVMEQLVNRIYAITGKKPIPTPPPEQEAEETADLSAKQPEDEEAATAQQDQKKKTCPVCGSDQLKMLDNAKRIGAGVAGYVAGAMMLGPLVGLAAGAAAGLLVAQRYQCKECGHKFEWKAESADADPIEKAEN